MRFAHPQFLWMLLVLVPVLAGFFVWSWRKRKYLIGCFVQSRLLAHLTVGVSATRQKLRMALFAAAVALLFVALARPQFGFQQEEVRQQGLDIVIAIDTSRSMLVQDITPNRLDRAKLAIIDLLHQARADRLALVPFAGTAFLQCPLTSDAGVFRQNVEALHVGIIPQGGSVLGEAIQTALAAFEKESSHHRVLVIFSDGEDNDVDGSAIASAQKAAREGLRIFTVGVGTAEGELIRITDEQGRVAFVKDEHGNVVKSRLNETLLQQIATIGNGFYLPLRGAKPMETLYAKGLAPLPKNESATRLVKHYRERYHWPLGMAIVLLILEMFLPDRRKVVRKDDVPAAEHGALRQAAVALFIFCLPFVAFASPAKAKKEYEAGNYQEALEEYRRLASQRTNDHRLHFNTGAAAYRAGQFKEAERRFQTSLQSPDLDLQEQAYYNLGNTYFRLGEAERNAKRRKTALENSLQNFQHALRLNPENPDTQHNAAFVRRVLEQLEQQPPPEQSQGSDDQEQSEDEEQQNSQQQQQQQGDNNQEQQEQDSAEQQDQQQGENQQNGEGEEGKENQSARGQEQEEKEAQPADSSGDDSGDEGEEESSTSATAVGQMTPEQARRMLDAVRQEDKPLLFAPPKKPVDARRLVRDW
jgi:Ca-activated chloride channel homolog